MMNMPLGSGLYDTEGQQPASPFPLGSGLFGQVPQLDNAPDAAGALPAPAGGEDKFSTLINNPMFQLGVNMIGNARNRQGGLSNALAGTLSAQYQGARAKREKAMTDLEAQRLGLEREKGVREEARGAREDRRADAQLPLIQAQIANFASEDAQRKALIELEGAKTDASRNKMDREAQAMDEGMRLLRGGGGGSQGAPPGANIGVGAAAQGDVGRYGTPTALLNNLMQTESSGNPNAMGPVLANGDRAMGAYQFTPQTVAMMKAQGHPFNPMDPKQSRDAADLYLQDLLKQHGGDWNKALASYGGFKSKDPSQYIGKVTKGLSMPTAGNIPIPNAQGGASPLDMIDAGALISLGSGDPKGLIEAGKARMPTNVTPNSYRMNPATGDLSEIPPTKWDVQKNAEGNKFKEREVQTSESNAARAAEKTSSDLRQVETKRAEEQTDAKGAYGDTVNNLTQMKDAAGALKNHPGLVYNTGWLGAVGADRIPGQGKDASVRLDELKSKLVVNTMMALKKASSTGATGFGQLSEQENKRLETYIRNLDRAQSMPQMKGALEDIENFATSSLGRYGERYKSLYGEGGAGVSNLGPDKGAPAPAEQPISLDEYLKKRGKK